MFIVTKFQKDPILHFFLGGEGSALSGHPVDFELSTWSGVYSEDRKAHQIEQGLKVKSVIKSFLTTS